MLGQKTLIKVFGKIGDPEGCLCIDLVVTLKALSEKDNMKPTVRARADDGYAEALLKYQTILTAQTFLRIFQQTTPLSKYLQTRGMDLLTAHRFVTSTQAHKGVKTATDACVQWANGKLNVCVTVRQTQKWNMRCQPGDQRRQKRFQASNVMTQPYQMLTASMRYKCTMSF